jgi:hypothetical protein
VRARNLVRRQRVKRVVVTLELAGGCCAKATRAVRR